jgi:hypothetical protein
MERRNRRNQFWSAARSITDDLLHRSERPGSAISGREQVQQRAPGLNLLNDLIGAGEQHGRHIEAKRLGGR